MNYYEAFGADTLQGLDGVTLQTVGENWEAGFLGLLSQTASLFPGSLGEGLRAALAITAVAALCAVAGSVLENGPARYVRLAGVLAIAALTVAGFNSLMAAGRDAIGQMNLYSKALLPSMAAASAASGQPASAVFRQAGTLFFSDLLITLYDRLLYPLLYVYAGLVTFNAALPHDMVKRLAGLVKWAAGGLLTATLVLFTAYLAVGGAISGSADAVSVKTAKTALGGFVPVVGGIIADASETLLLGAAVIKNSVGIFGLLAILGIALGPCAALAARVLCVKLGAALTGTLGGEGLAGYVDDLAGLYAMMLGLVSASAFLLVISVAATILAA